MTKRKATRLPKAMYPQIPYTPPTKPKLTLDEALKKINATYPKRVTYPKRNRT